MYRAALVRQRYLLLLVASFLFALLLSDSDIDAIDHNFSSSYEESNADSFSLYPSLPPGKLSFTNGSIDAVVTFVNGSDPIWLKQRTDTLSRLGLPLPESFQFRSNNELVYCLRSIWHNVPQLRHVFLILSGPSQVPSWLNHSNPYLTIVYHHEFFPHFAVLPTFNSYSIESNLWRIPYLSNTFIYLNDDFFISSPLPSNFIRDSDSYFQVHLDTTTFSRPINQYRRGLLNGGRLLSRRFPLPFRSSTLTWYPLSHSVYACNKDILEETSRVFSKAYRIINQNPFRTQSGLPHFLFFGGSLLRSKIIGNVIKAV
ncbi:hypothetical protein GEMRC1_003000 [Eukaryota sp. GEM-RC1]